MSLLAKANTTSLLFCWLWMSACSGDTASAPDAASIVDAAVSDADDGVLPDARMVTDAAPQPDAEPGISCSVPAELQGGGSHLGTTTGFPNNLNASCSPATGQAPDAIYRVTLPSEPTDLIAEVNVDESAEEVFDAVLAVRESCLSSASEVACSDFARSERVEALELSDEAFVIVDGTSQFGGLNAGEYELTVSTRDIVASGEACDPEGLASRCESGQFCQSGLCASESAAAICAAAPQIATGQSTGGRTHRFQTSFRDASCAFDSGLGAPEAMYLLSLASPQSVAISTDYVDTSFDTVLTLIAACEGSELACHDDVAPQLGNFRSRIEVQDLAAGDYFIVVDGSSSAAPQGRFELSVELLP